MSNGLWFWAFGLYDRSYQSSSGGSKMEKTNFENLQIYKLAERLADHIWRVVIRWDNLAKDTVGKQLIRSADSIGANVAEGSGRGTDPEVRRFLRVARGSLYETQHWLRRAYRRKLLTDKQVNDLLPIVKELTPKLNAYLRSIGSFRRPLSSKNLKV